VAVGEGDSLGPAVYAELGEDVLDVGRDRLLADHETPGHRRLILAGGQMFEHL
jgi:hypothetical protein